MAITLAEAKVGMTRREALQQLAFTTGAVVTTQGGDAIGLVPVETAVSGKFPPNTLFNKSKLKTEPRVAVVEVVSHSYTPSSEVETLAEEHLSGENMMLSFDSPHHSYSISGGTIIASGANWVTVTANGQVTLTGKKYVHTTCRHAQRNAAASLQERNNILSVDKVTLINSSNVGAILKRLYEISKLWQTLTNDAVITGQKAGQIVAAANPWGSVIRGYITSMDSRLTPNGQTASITILGEDMVPEPAVLYAGDTYAGNGEVLY